MGLLVIAWVVFLGFFREFFFLNVNYNLSYLLGERMYNYSDSSMQFLQDYGIETLYSLKWVGTIIFFLLFWCTGVLFIKLFYNIRKYYVIYSLIYLALFVFAGGAYTIGYWVGEVNEGYTLARQIMGWGQSPIPLMFLWGGVHLDRQKIKKDV